MDLYPGHDRLADKDKQLFRQVLERARPMRERQIKRLEHSIGLERETEYHVKPGCQDNSVRPSVSSPCSLNWPYWPEKQPHHATPSIIAVENTANFGNDGDLVQVISVFQRQLWVARQPAKH